MVCIIILKFTSPDDVLKALQATTLVNTWHINEVESAAMWDLYSNKNAGIAIQSTYKRLSESFINNKEDVVWIGIVKYIDYNRDLSGFFNIFDAFTCKRLSFQHEIELSFHFIARTSVYRKPVRSEQ